MSVHLSQAREEMPYPAESKDAGEIETHSPDAYGPVSGLGSSALSGLLGKFEVFRLLVSGI